jgi:hypothetical protein
MKDPFEALREPVRPVDPDPDFAGRLWTRLSREVFAPQEEPCPSRPERPGSSASPPGLRR